MKIFKILRTHLKKYSKLFSLFFLLNIVISLLTMVIPQLSGIFIDMLLNSFEKDHITDFILFFLFINLSILFGTYLNRLIYTRLQSYCTFDFNKMILQHLHNVEYIFFSNKDPIYLTQRINSDCSNLVIFSITLFQNILSNVMSLLVPIFFIWSLNYQMAIVIIIFNLVNFLLVYTFKKHIYLTGYAVKEYTNKYFSFLNTLLTRIKFIKVNEYSDKIISKLQSKFDVVFSKVLKQQIVLNNYFSLSKLNNILQSAAIFFLGGNLVTNGILTIGNLSVCFSYMTTINSAINYFLNLGQEFQNIKSSEARISELLAVPIEKNGKTKIYNIEKISIEHLGFKFNNNTLYTDLNLSFKQNKIYGIEGKNGTGKTTLIDIIVGLYQQNYNGNIKFNDILQENLDMKFLREQCVVYCFQKNDFLDSEIHEKLIKENTDLLKKFNLEFSNHFIESLREDNLSGGEKQKLNLLYCLSKQSSTLMIFDEPSSYLDEETVKNLMAMINKIKKGKIIIIASHDRRVLKQCDTIISIDRGGMKILNNES